MAMGWSEPRVRPVERGRTVLSILNAIFRLIPSMLLLVAIYVVSFYLLDTRVGYTTGAENVLADPAWWMSWGHAVLVLAFFSIMLTNRAHGALMALAQVVLSWTVISLLLLFAGYSYGFAEVRTGLMPTQVMWAFLIGLFLGHVAAIYLFDWQRGVPWWKAPLIATLVGPFLFVVLFYSFGYWGADVPWGAWLWTHYLVLAGAGLALMGPYAMLRRSIKPAPGHGGA